MDKLESLKSDVAELQSLLEKATRPKVKDILSIECRKLVTEVVKIEEVLKKQDANSTFPHNAAAAPTTTTSQKRYEIRLTNYAWDQSNKFVKFYVTLKNVQSLQPENVTCHFTPSSLELKVTNLEGRDYIFTVNNLLKTIKPEASNWKLKSDMVLINVAKEEASDWSHVTQVEKKVSDAKLKPEIDKSDDPTQGLMNMMKNMYEQGDDEMKRTIAKAWTEGQQKQHMM